MVKSKITPYFVICALVFGINAQAEDNISERPIRVAVMRDADSIIVSVRQDYNFLSLKPQAQIAQGARIYARVSASEGGVTIGRDEFKLSAVKVVTQEGATINLNGRPYRGTITIIRNADKKLLVVNELGLEEYLAGVLYEEVSHRWPIEVLKAQAIAARTFARYQMEQNASREYDLTADTYSQVYGGSSSERERARRAVGSTAGAVLTYNGKIFPAYYHATCGGATENADNLWKIDLAPLKSVKCDWCRRSPHYRWKARLTLDEVQKRLNAAGIKVEEIEDISVAAYNSSGRVKEIKVTTKTEERVMGAKDFRLAVGSKILRSTKFSISVDNFFKDTLFDGLGWGHGVGMCQWGAYFMSRKGKKAEEILKFYYPEAEIKNAP